MSKKMRVILIVFSSLVTLVVLALIFGTMGMNEIREYTIPTIDLSSKEDGIYTGMLTRTRWALTVKVTLDNHVITSIEIIDRKSSNITKDLLNKLEKQLINTKNPRFDVISGASMTTKGYLIAVADALR